MVIPRPARRFVNFDISQAGRNAAAGELINRWNMIVTTENDLFPMPAPCFQTGLQGWLSEVIEAFNRGSLSARRGMKRAVVGYNKIFSYDR